MMTPMGYEFFTTFWQDFSFAEMFGKDVVEETYKHCIKEWESDYKYLTELELVLNWKLWEHYENGREDLAKLYDSLWRKCGERFRKLYGNDDEKSQYHFWVLD